MYIYVILNLKNEYYDFKQREFIESCNVNCILPSEYVAKIIFECLDIDDSRIGILDLGDSINYINEPLKSLVIPSESGLKVKNPEKVAKQLEKDHQGFIKLEK